MNYRKLIAEMSKEADTVRGFAYRISSMIRTAHFMKIAATDIIFDFDKETDKLIVTKNGEKLAEYNGDDSWGKCVEDFKRAIHRKSIDPKDTRFLFKSPKGLVDVKYEFQQAA